MDAERLRGPAHSEMTRPTKRHAESSSHTSAPDRPSKCPDSHTDVLENNVPVLFSHFPHDLSSNLAESTSFQRRRWTINRRTERHLTIVSMRLQNSTPKFTTS